MTSLVTSSNLAPLDSFRHCHVSSRTRTGVGRGTEKRRTLLGIGNFVIDSPFDEQLTFRQNLQDYQEQHRGVVKPQINQLPEVPFRLSNPKRGEGDVNGGKQKAEEVIGQLLPLPQRVAPGHQSYLTYSSPSLSSNDSVAVRKKDESRLESGGCFPSLAADTRKLVANVLRGGRARASQERKGGVAHERRKNQSVDRCMEEGSPMEQREVSETLHWPRLQTLNCSLTTDLTHKLSLHKETTRLKPSLAFESSGPSSKDHVMATKTRLLGDLIPAGKLAGPCKAKQTSQLAAGYNKRHSIPPMGVEGSVSSWSSRIPDREWIDLVNIQLVDYDNYDRYASRRRPNVSRGNRCSEKLYCVDGANLKFLQPYATLGQEIDEEVGQELDEGVGQELDEGGQELDEGVGQEMGEEESSRETVQSSFEKYSSKSRYKNYDEGLT